MDDGQGGTRQAEIEAIVRRGVGAECRQGRESICRHQAASLFWSSLAARRLRTEAGAQGSYRLRSIRISDAVFPERGPTRIPSMSNSQSANGTLIVRTPLTTW